MSLGGDTASLSGRKLERETAWCVPRGAWEPSDALTNALTNASPSLC